MSIINNIGVLREELIRNNWHMTAFIFEYNGYTYDVLFENNENISTRKEKYASVLLTFIDISNPNRTLSVEANQIRFFIDAQTLRNYFFIKYSPNLGDILRQLFCCFVDFVPPSIPPILLPRQDAAINHRLAYLDGHNPNAIYCYDARRLGKRNGFQMHRSIYIDNLTQRLRPALYSHFASETTVTFYFSDDPAREMNDIGILTNFAKREATRSS